MNTARVQLPNVLAALFRGGCAVGNAEAGFARRTRHRGRRDTLSNRQEFRRIWDDLVTELVRQLLIGLQTHAHRRRRSVIGIALKLVDQIFTSIVRLLVGAVLLVDQTDVVVSVDQGRHHRLARQIHTNGVCRRLTISFFADPRKGIALDQERRAFNGRRPVADDQARAFEPHWRAPRLRRG